MKDGEPWGILGSPGGDDQIPGRRGVARAK